MSQAAAPRMTLDEFWEWQDRQDIRYELVDGIPWAMAGAQQRHDVILTNALVEIGGQLRGKPCRVFSADQTVVTRAANGRRPNVGVDCGPLDGSSMRASSPRVVIEVLSRSTRLLDQVGKLEEYKDVDSMEHVALVDPDEAYVILWSRDADRTWAMSPFRDLEDVLPLAAVGVSLPLAVLYDRLDVRSRPQAIPLV
jgi:Uma2 family endonuclease